MSSQPLKSGCSCEEISCEDILSLSRRETQERTHAGQAWQLNQTENEPRLIWRPESSHLVCNLLEGWNWNKRGGVLCERLLNCFSVAEVIPLRWSSSGGVGGSALLFSFSFYVQTKKKSDGFFSRAFLSHAADVWGDAGGLVFVRRTPGYAWWHPGWTRASKGQRYKLFSLKFCISVGSDGSTWEGLIHATLKAARRQRMLVEMQMNDQTGRTINSLMLTETSLHLKYRWCTKEEAFIDLGLNISQWNLHKSSR